jgi:hypothetical protein
MEYHNRLDELLPRKLGISFYQEALNSTTKQTHLYDTLLEFNKNFDETFGTHTFEALENVLRNAGWLREP